MNRTCSASNHRILLIQGDLHAILEIQEAFALKDWLRFFDAFRNLRFFSMVLASRMLPTVREHALKTVVKAMSKFYTVDGAQSY